MGYYYIKLTPAKDEATEHSSRTSEVFIVKLAMRQLTV
jgi:hypothetical protein